MFTVRDLFAIVSPQSVFPLKVSELRAQFPVTPEFSVRSIIEKVANQKVVIFVQVRNISLLASSTSFDDLKAKFLATPASGQDIKTLATILDSQQGVGLTLPSQQGVGVTGTARAVAPVPVAVISDSNHQVISDFVMGAAGLLRGSPRRRAATGPFGLLVVGAVLAVNASLTFIVMGILGAIHTLPGSSTPTQPPATTSTAPAQIGDSDGSFPVSGDPGDLTQAIVYGSIPQGWTVESLVESGLVDVTAIPDLLPDNPLLGPGGDASGLPGIGDGTGDGFGDDGDSGFGSIG